MKRLILCSECSEHMTDALAELRVLWRSRSGFLRSRSRCDCCNEVLLCGWIATTWSIQVREDDSFDEEWDRSVLGEGGAS